MQYIEAAPPLVLFTGILGGFLGNIGWRETSEQLGEYINKGQFATQDFSDTLVLTHWLKRRRKLVICSLSGFKSEDLGSLILVQKCILLISCEPHEVQCSMEFYTYHSSKFILASKRDFKMTFYKLESSRVGY